ncbi:Myocardin-related transcription factor B [Frankliniella fusca]|uniref:Myocardin-related transcription factor B n=1 Tax=Frankliniella fusca TaxID=407009 RepID=A0AAE1HYT5_9NEOP|nr:Myocardin-related transcription factor B [Frankliniella fusca]
MFSPIFPLTCWTPSPPSTRTGSERRSGSGPRPPWLRRGPSTAPPGGAAPAAPAAPVPVPVPLQAPPPLPPLGSPVPSPPKAEVDDTPLHKAMDRNKESLKVKLMLRRPYTQLVAQGIMPPLKTPPAFHEQRKQLERAKTGDLLKAKIQQRPDRQELVRQHILEADMDHVDPSLAERQRMLKKCRLADSLNDQLAHRPGPLELIQKNILHADETIERAVKEGVIPFKATCEGQKTKPAHPHRYITMDEDSQSSGESSVLSPPGPPQTPSLQSAPSPAPAPTPAPAASAPAPAPAATATALLVPRRLSGGSDVIETAAANAGIVTLALSIPSGAQGGASLPVVVASAAPVLQSQQQVLQRPPSCAPSAPLQTLCSAMAPSPMSLGSSASSLSLSPPSSLSSVSVSSPPSCSSASVPSPITPRPAAQSSPSPAPGAGLGSGTLSGLPLLSQQDALRTAAPGKDKNRKKSKNKAQPKTRTIKFHEYKGPPNAHKTSLLSSSPVETSYELLLQQQQLLLQCQLDWLHKYPQIILPAAQKPSSNIESSNNTPSSSIGTNISASQPTPVTSVAPVTTNSTQLGLITVTSSSAATGVTVNSIGSTTGTLLGVGNGSGTLVLTAQPSPSPVQSAVATVVPAPTPQTITVTLPAQQQQQAQVTLQPPLQVTQAIVEPLQTSSPCLNTGSQSSSQAAPQMQTTFKILGKLEEMKVSDLKMELKKRNLPVSGSKPQLIERIRNADAAAAAAAVDCNGTVLNASSTEGNQADQPMDIQVDVSLDTTHTSAEDSLSGIASDISGQQSTPQPPSAATSNMDLGTTSVNTPQMSPVSPAAAPSPSSSIHDMDTTPVSPSPSPVTHENLIREQQRQIKELQKQVKLLQSQKQLEALRAKEIISQQQGLNAKASLAAFLQQQQALSPANNSNNMNSNNNNNNSIVNNNNNNNNLNNLNNNLINKKLSKTLVVQPQIQQVSQSQQQRQQNQEQQQQEQQQQQQQQAAAAAAIVLNHINSQSKKGLSNLATFAGITGVNSNHQRTNSLPNFLASMVQLTPSTESKPSSSHQQRASSVTPMAVNEDVDMKPAILPTHRLVLTRTTTEPHILTLTTAPAAASSAANGTATIMAATNAIVPVSLAEGVTFSVTPSNGVKLPQYEEVASLLKNIKQEPSEKKSVGRQSIKSQIVDDVLDILIKSGELPPSAAQDPTTPTPAGTNAGGGSAETSSPNACGAYNNARDNAEMFSAVFSPRSTASPEQSLTSAQSAPSSTPPPPPPPPLPHTSFAVTLPTALSLTTNASIPPNENSFSLFGGSNSLDYILGSNGPPATSVDLKELGLDLETLDSMDFGQLDAAASAEVKLEPSDINMEAESDDMQSLPVKRNESGLQDRHLQHHQNLHQNQQLAEQLLSAPSELMDICDMSEMDSDWLDSLMAPNEPSAESTENSTYSSSSLLPSSSSSSYIHMNGHTDIDSYDPLLPNNQDPLDLFSMDTMDSDFKMPSELGLTINWDKVDFAT